MGDHEHYTHHEAIECAACQTAETPGGGGLTEAEWGREWRQAWVDLIADSERVAVERLSTAVGGVNPTVADAAGVTVNIGDVRRVLRALAAAEQARAEVVARVEAESAAKVLHEMACEDNPGHADWTDCTTTGPCRDEGERFATLAALAGPNPRGGQDGGGE